MAEKSNKINLPANINYWQVPVHILPPDFDRLGHVNNVVYLRYVQEVATAHWMAVATPEQSAQSIWVVRRHEIDYNHPILPGNDLLGLTWVHQPTGMRFERSVWLVSPDKERVYAQAKTTWLLLDPKTGRPKKVDEELLEGFREWMVGE